MFELLTIAAIALATLYLRHRWNQTKPTVDVPESSDQCVACNSHRVTRLGPEVYRCRACGFEGGPGLAALQRTKRLEAAQKLDPETRRKQARTELEQARAHLEGASAIIKGALSFSHLDMLGVGQGRSKQHEVNNAITRIIEAQHHLERAGELTGKDEAREEITFELPESMRLADIHLDDGLTDLVFHSKLKDLELQTSALLQRVERTLNRT